MTFLIVPLTVQGQKQAPSQAPLKLLPMTGFPTPDPTVFSNKTSVEYFKEKSRLFACVIEAQRGPNQRTAIGEGVVRVCWYEAKHTNKTNCERLTAVHGSMLASDLINLQREKIRKEDEAVAAKGDYQADLRAKYDKCKGGCTCTETSCQAKGLFLCMSLMSALVWCDEKANLPSEEMHCSPLCCKCDVVATFTKQALSSKEAEESSQGGRGE